VGLFGFFGGVLVFGCFGVLEDVEGVCWGWVGWDEMVRVRVRVMVVYGGRRRRKGFR